LNGVAALTSAWKTLKLTILQVQAIFDFVFFLQHFLCLCFLVPKHDRTAVVVHKQIISDPPTYLQDKEHTIKRSSKTLVHLQFTEGYLSILEARHNGSWSGVVQPSDWLHKTTLFQAAV
jgi:hypothetical protein